LRADKKPVNIPELSATLYSLAGYLGAAYDEFRTDDPALATNFMSFRQAIGDLRKEMLSGTEADVEEHPTKLAIFQQALFNDVHETFSALQNQDNRAPLMVQDLPEALHNRFIGVTGKYLLMVYPKKDVWQRENQREFLEQVQAVYPNVTGTPIQ